MPARARIPECGHPDRPHGGRGLCDPCYERSRPKRARLASTCHPARLAVSRGLCGPCYNRGRPALCAHPTRRRYRGGLCRICAGHSWPKRQRDPDANRRHTLAVYGLTVAEYDALLEAQGGACAICRQPPAHGKRLHVDHDHETDVVRGLLCLPCNRAIGLLRDDPEVARRAAEYLTMPLPERRIRLVG